MSKVFQSVFARDRRVLPPERETPLMRVLEPRVLLDAAALETALDVAQQAVHSDLAEAYLSPEAQARPAGERTPFAVHRSAAYDGLLNIVQEDGADETAVAEANGRHEVAFVDGSLADIETLVAGFGPGVDVHVIDPETDGLAFVARTLEGERDVDAVHLLSHGSQGRLILGANTLDASAPSSDDARAFVTIRAALAEEADLLVYGCDFAAGEDGRRAALALALATGADVAASDDLTGAEDLGGDWDLELRVGEIETRSLKVEAFEGVLADEYSIAVAGAPETSHPSADPIGSLGTVVRYRDAVTFTPDGGGPAQTFDLVGQFIGFTGDVSVSFTGEGDDLGIVVNNLGTVDPQTGLTPPGAATISWIIQEPVNLSQVPLGTVDLAIDGLYGVGGQPDSGTGVSIDLSELSSYTLDAGTTLADYVVADEDTLLVFGTEDADATGDADQVAFRWDTTSGVVTSFHTRESETLFVVDGNRDASFGNGATTQTRVVDLNGAAAGNDFATVYRNAGPNPGDEAGAPIVDLGIELFDINDRAVELVTVVLENAQAGDALVYDETLALALGIEAYVAFDLPTVTLELYSDDINNGTLLQNFEDFLRSVAFRNDLPDGSFDRTTPRTVSISFDDADATSPVATTTITFEDAPDAITAVPTLEVAEEDASIIRNAATGLLSHVANPVGRPLEIVVASVDGSALALGQSFSVPDRGMLRLNADGSFDFTPLPNASGSFTVAVTISDGVGTVDTALIINMASEADTPTLSLTLPSAPTNEDEPTARLHVVAEATDPSETFAVRVEGLPDGVIVEDDAGNTHRSRPDDEPWIDVTGWNLDALRVLPVEDSDEEISFRIVARSTETDGRFAEVQQEVTFQIDAVADAPELIANPAIAPVDGTAALGQFIEVRSRDADASETLGDITIAGIANDGVSFQVDGVDRVVDFSAGPGNGVVTLSFEELAFLTMRGPGDGEEHGYQYLVTAQSSETAANGDVAVRTATAGPVTLNIAFDNSDDPVVIRPDTFTTAAGAVVTLDLTENDTGLDGGLEIDAINGTPVATGSAYTFPGGEGTATLDGRGGLTFTAAAGFSGTLVFDYTASDFDGDAGTATVVVEIEPVWNISVANPDGTEGGTFDLSIALNGSPRAGETASVVPSVSYGTARPEDVASLDAAIADAVLAHPDFSFDGTTLTFAAPIGGHEVSTRTDVAIEDIAATGAPVDMSSGSATFRLGFPFTFNGVDRGQVFIMPDGLLTFGGPLPPRENGPLDGTAFNGATLLAPFWDSIDVSTGSVTTAVEGVPGARTATIQWTGTPFGGTETITFQAVLFESNGAIEYRYLDVAAGGAASHGAQATIGLQGNGVGTSFSENAPALSDGLVVRFDPAAVIAPRLDVSVGITDDADYEELETLSFAIAATQDSRVGTGEAEVTIAFSDNAAPEPQPDSATTPKNEAVAIDVVDGTEPGIGVDRDPQGQPLTIVALDGTAVVAGETVTLASGATVELLSDGSVSYDPNGQFNGLLPGDSAIDTFAYTVSDGFDGRASTTVSVTIEGVNVPPAIELDGIAGGSGDTLISYPDTANRVAVAPVALVTDLENDLFTDLSVSIAGFIQGADEEIIVGSATVLPGIALTQPITVGPHTFDLVYDGAATITITDPGNAPIPNEAMEALLRSFTYDNTAVTDIEGDRTFRFTTGDAAARSAEATATVRVLGSNKPPVPVNDGSGAAPHLVGTEDEALVIDTAALVANDSDPEGDAFAITGYENAVGGRIEIAPDGTVSFVPDKDHEGEASFDYRVTDTEGGSATATVSLSFDGVNDAPTIDLDPGSQTDDAVSDYTEDGAPTPILPAGAVLADVDSTDLVGVGVAFDAAVGDRLVVGTLPPGIDVILSRADLASGVASGGPVTLSLVGTASVEDYTAALQAIGFATASDAPDTSPRAIRITLTDGELTSNTVENRMVVFAANDAPVAQTDGVYATDEDTELRVSIASLLANDSDPDGTQPAFTGLVDAVNGTAVVDGFEVVFTPDPDANGSGSFRYTIGDGEAPDVTGTANVEIRAVNDAPALDADASTASVDATRAVTFDEDVGAVRLFDADLGIVDVDHATLGAATITLANGAAGDLLRYGTPPDGVSVTRSPAGPLVSSGVQTVTATGTAPIAEYRDWLANVRFDNVSDAPSETPREITVEVGDGSLPSNAVTVEVAVIARNDAPVAVVDATQEVDEDGVLVVPVATLLANDFGSRRGNAGHGRRGQRGRRNRGAGHRRQRGVPADSGHVRPGELRLHDPRRGG